ncbi:VOC family protein [Kineococcus endophyticus]|uniref:VOC family protein n=1 Tax=Kineococcus endophyticus TaxID=1181883 RepID=A0ABV3PAB4_9ACTN
MRIDHVVLPVPDVRRSAAFWRDALGLTVHEAEASCVVEVGWTSLQLVPDPDAQPGTQHLAITVPGDAGPAALAWLRERATVLGDGLVELSPSWDGCSVYFEDAPGGTVLELVARRRLPHRLGGAAFGPEHLLGVSEVGVPVACVPTARERLARGAGLPTFGGPGSPQFTAVGDDEGLLVLVAPDRPWFPTRDRPARATRLDVTLSGTRGRGALLLNPGTLVSYR